MKILKRELNMQQLEIQYFFPLTEQIDLDLDFNPCKEYDEQKQREWLAQSTVTSGEFLIAGGGIGTTTWAAPHTILFKPEDDSVGYWELGKGFHFYNKKKPNWLHQKMVALLMGLKWKDK